MSTIAAFFVGAQLLLGAGPVGTDHEVWVEFLRAYMRVDTTNPPGNEARAFDLLSGRLAGLQLAPETAHLAAGRGNLWARLRAPNPDPGARPLILLHHIDVVPAEREHWSVDPFAAELRDGVLYGRGAVDMKSLGVIQLAALERLAQQRSRLRRDVIYLAVADEEAFGLGAQAIVRDQLPEWNAEYLLDEGGFAIRDFLNGKDVFVIATSQKRNCVLEIVATGEAGHGSRPVQAGGINILAEAIRRIEENPAPMRLLESNKMLFSSFARMSAFPKSFLLSKIHWPLVLDMLEGTLGANKNLNPIMRDTSSVTMISGGTKVNVIPATASATLDVRLLPDTRLEDYLTFLAGVLEGLPVRIEVRVPPRAHAVNVSAEDPLYKALAGAVRRTDPATEIAPWVSVGVTDSRFFAPSVKTYGFHPVFIDKAQIDGIHGHDERIRVQAFGRGIEIYRAALDAFLLRPKEGQGPT